MIKKTRRGFTLTEVLITLVIVAVISLLLMGLIGDIFPNENISLAKKAFNVLQTNVRDMTNNAEFYINGEFTTLSSTLSVDQKNKYFCEHFADGLSIDGAIDCDNSSFPSNPIRSYDATNGGDPANFDATCSAMGNRNIPPAFITSDGVAWYGLTGQFEDSLTRYKVICIDVAPDSDDNTKFGVGVRYDGRVVPGKILSNCLNADPTSNNNGNCTL